MGQAEDTQAKSPLDCANSLCTSISDDGEGATGWLIENLPCAEVVIKWLGVCPNCTRAAA